MKKFIILLAATTCLFTAVQAQQKPKITKMYVKNALGQNQPWLDLGKDTLFFPASFANVERLSLYWGFELTNGDIALQEGDTIMLRGTVGGSTVFAFMTDTKIGINGYGYFYVLDEELGAGESIPIKFDDPLEMENVGMVYREIFSSNMHISTDSNGKNDTLYKVPVFGQVLYASHYGPVSTSSMMTADALIMRKKSNPTPAVIETVMEQIKCYPNPVSSNLTITNLKNTTVELYNIVGQRIVQQENVSGDISIDMKEYPEGVYFVKIQNGKAVRTEKIKLVK